MDQNFSDKLEKHENTAELLDQSFKSGVGFFSEIAMILNGRKQPDASKQILWNLFEVFDDPITAIRIIAYWYAEFGDIAGAEKLLFSALDDSEPATRDSGAYRP